MFQRLFDFQSTSFLTTLRTFLVGFVTGISTWLIVLGLSKFVLTPILCQGQASSCSAVSPTATIIALLLAHFVALIALVRMGVLRPLLVILAVIASLWGFQQWFSLAPWWLASLQSGLLFGLAFLAYMWINRVLSFPVALLPRAY